MFNTSGNILRRTRNSLLLVAALTGGVLLTSCSGSEKDETVSFGVDVECPKGDDPFILYIEEAMPSGQYLLADVEADAYVDISCGTYGEGFTAPINTTLATDSSHIPSNTTRIRIDARYSKTKSVFGNTTSATPSASVKEDRFVVNDDTPNPATAVFLKNVDYIYNVDVKN